MTREQKALAAFGSVAAVGLLLVAIWSVPGGLLLLVIGVVAVVAGLRLTHPKGRGRPTARSLGLLGGPPAPARPLSEEELAAQKLELERRRLEQERRALEREERRRQQQEARARRRREREEAAARRAAERAERARVEQERRAEAEQRRHDHGEVERGAREAPEPRPQDDPARGRDGEDRGARGAEPPPRADATVVDGGATSGDAAILAASERAQLPSGARRGDLDEAQQRIQLLNEVQLRLRDYE